MLFLVGCITETKHCKWFFLRAFYRLQKWKYLYGPFLHICTYENKLRTTGPLCLSVRPSTCSLSWSSRPNLEQWFLRIRESRSFNLIPLIPSPHLIISGFCGSIALGFDSCHLFPFFFCFPSLFYELVRKKPMVHTNPWWAQPFIFSESVQYAHYQHIVSSTNVQGGKKLKRFTCVLKCQCDKPSPCVDNSTILVDCLR